MSHRANDIPREEFSILSPSRVLPDPSELRALIYRRRWPFLLTFGVTLLVAILVLALAPRSYTATSALQLEPREAVPVKVNDRGFVAPADDNLIDTAVQIIRSPALTLDVVRSLHLDRLPELGGRQDKPVSPAAGTSGGDDGTTMSPAERRAVSTLLAHSFVRRVGATYLVEISVSSADPRLAARIANALARRYIDLGASKRRMRNTEAARYAESRAADLRRQAVADDTALQNYMIQNNLMSAQGATMAEQEVSELNRQIADAQAQLAEQRGKLGAARQQVARGGGGADVGTALASETIRQLRQQEAQASAKLAQLDARYGNLHPEVAQARDELADIHRQLDAELSRILSGLRGDVQIAESRLGSLLASRSNARGSLAQNNSAQVTRFELERRAEASRGIYNAYLTRAKEAAQASELPDAEATVASLARIPGAPTSPNILLGSVAALLAALILGTIAAGLVEYLTDSVATRRDIETGLGMAYAGAVPSLASVARAKNEGMSPQDYVVARPTSLFTESLRNLATYLGLVSGDAAMVVTITSALPREGKSTTAMCLARTLALAKRKVVLVDADARHHSASNALLCGQNEEGLFRVLDGSTPLADALISDDRTSLKILGTMGQVGPDDVLTQPGMATLFTALRLDFDIVVVDSPPVLGLAETRMISGLSDVTLLIARWRNTPLKAVRTALDLLVQHGSRIGGVALSQVNIKEYASAGLTDALGYHRKFKGYYAD